MICVYCNEDILGSESVVIPTTAGCDEHAVHSFCRKEIEEIARQFDFGLSCEHEGCGKPILGWRKYSSPEVAYAGQAE